MTTTAKPADLIRAEALIEQAARDARAYAERCAAPKQADSTVRYAYEAGILQGHLKTLCQEVAIYKDMCAELRRQKAQAYDDLEIAGMMSSDSEDSPARFTVNDAADAARWGA